MCERLERLKAIEDIEPRAFNSPVAQLTIRFLLATSVP